MFCAVLELRLLQFGFILEIQLSISQILLLTSLLPLSQTASHCPIPSFVVVNPEEVLILSVQIFLELRVFQIFGTNKQEIQ